MELYRGDRLISSIPLGEQIALMQYDWQEANLKDIYLGVDYAEATVEISIQGWKSDEFEIII